MPEYTGCPTLMSPNDYTITDYMIKSRAVIYYLSTVNNYGTKLMKILLWYVSGEQINYWSARHWPITIFCDDQVQFNNCFIIRSPSLFSNEYLREAKRSAIFNTRAIARGRKACFRLHMSRILFAAKQSWTILSMSRPLFVGSYLQVTWWAFGQ